MIAQLKVNTLRAGAFSAIVREHSESIYWYVRRMVLVHDDANDIVQNTFTKAWMNIESFQGKSKISTWLYRIAINETLTFLNKNQNTTVSLDSPDGAIAEFLESDTHFCGNKADAMLQEAIARLPEKQRQVFNLKYFNEIKYEEMSKMLNTSVGALKASYHIAVKKIEEYIGNVEIS
ncbi:MAG: sigma-70 family RNA polymerase sigma factor [Bacteroidaceae bacterium]|nr:sigma-70 family RNA polymerase sigma factor [Bacteroidaceae bacterium]